MMRALTLMRMLPYSPAPSRSIAVIIVARPARCPVVFMRLARPGHAERVRHSEVGHERPVRSHVGCVVWLVEPVSYGMARHPCAR